MKILPGKAKYPVHDFGVEAVKAHADGQYIHVIRVPVMSTVAGIGEKWAGSAPEITEAIKQVSAAGWALQLPLSFATPSTSSNSVVVWSATECWATFLRR